MILALTALGSAFAGAGALFAFLKWRATRTSPTTAKTAEMEKLAKRVTRVHSQDLGTQLEMATTSAFDAVHGWTRAVDPLSRGALQREAIMAVRAQLALLEEQRRRGIH